MQFNLLMVLSVFTACAVSAATPALYDIPLKDIKGKDTSLKAYEGQVLLVVNVASKCGLTRQYAGLEKLYRDHKAKGLTVLGFPCNDFAGQEPGSNQEIQKFCKDNFDVSFPMFDKLHVKGQGQHALYTALSGPGSPFPGDVAWNFGKFLISRDGKILARFEPRTAPDAPELLAAIDKALAQGK
jgi:glutathione peroxidase